MRDCRSRQQRRDRAGGSRILVELKVSEDDAGRIESRIDPWAFDRLLTKRPPQRRSAHDKADLSDHQPVSACADGWGIASSSLSAGITLMRVARRAGARPQSTAVRSDSVSV